MQELLLVNPRRRKRRAGTRRRRGARRMTAKQLKYFGPRSNPRRRRRRSGGRRRHMSVGVARNPIRRHRRRRSYGLRRNPSSIRRFSPRSFMNDTLMPSAIGAMGALGVDIAMVYAAPYLPAMLTTGFGASIARLGGAVGVGMLASKTMGKRYGDQVTAGAVTVTLYSLIKSQIVSMGLVPGLSGMGWISPAWQVGTGMHGMGTYVEGMSAYDGGYGGALNGLGMNHFQNENESAYYASY
jgi:hypothetical protein